MTDTPYSDELDEILMKLARNTTLADRAAGVASTVSTLKDASKIFDWSISEAKAAKQAILDWHNKQIEEVLDRLEAEKLDLPTTPVDSHGYPQGGIQRIYPFIPLLAIEAERNKLKESN